MPHIVIEFSNEIDQLCDMQLICKKLFNALSEDTIFKPSEVKVRAIPVAYSHIGTSPQTFVHATLLLIEGRDKQVRKTLNTKIAETLRACLPDVGSITVQDQEITQATYFKDLI